MIMAQVDIAHKRHYEFQRGFPIGDTAQEAYDDADLNRAVQAYRLFYPTASGAAIVKGNEEIGVVPNKVFGILGCAPEQLVFTANSDTPYGPLMLDLATRKCVCSPLATAAPIGWSGRTASGSGPYCALRTAISTRGTISTPMRARNGSIKRSAHRPPCSAVTKKNAGSLYWLGLRDSEGNYLDGGKTYKLSVPGKLFWSVTVYDAETRSQVQTDRHKAALRSLFELKDLSGTSVDLYFGPTAVNRT
jgi:hypothetical protein